jgi:predicted SprT family Zn-dependent metalloprotease
MNTHETHDNSKPTLADAAGSGLVTYLVNCDCGAYKWTRRRVPGGMFMRCLSCGNRLGPMQFMIAPNDKLSGGEKATEQRL